MAECEESFQTCQILLVPDLNGALLIFTQCFSTTDFSCCSWCSININHLEENGERLNIQLSYHYVAQDFIMQLQM